MLLVLKLCPIQVIISLPLWIKLTMGQLLLFFLCNFCSFFSYVGGVLVTNLFHCYWLVVYFGYSTNYNTRGAFVILFLICSNLLNFFRSVGPMVVTTKQWLNLPQNHFHQAIPHQSYHFSPFWWILYRATPDISNSRENINNKALVSRLSFCFLWLCSK